MKPASKTSKINNAQKALVHVAKTDLRRQGVLDEEGYRDALAIYGGVQGEPPSSKDLTPAGLEALMRHFHKCGFRQLYKPRPGEAAEPEDHRLEAGATQEPDLARLPPAKRGVLALIGRTLAKLDKPWAYAGGIAARMFGVDELTWCSKEELQKVLAALVYQERRAAVASKPKRREVVNGQ